MSSKEADVPIRCSLQILNGLESGRIRQLNRRAKIGRNLDCEVRIDESKVSRSHAVLDYTPQGWILTDQNSSNGTWVNGKRITTPQRLVSGDELMFGETKMIFSDLTLATAETIHPPIANFCPGCGMAVTMEMRFCQRCGTLVNDILPPSAPRRPSQQAPAFPAEPFPAFPTPENRPVPELRKPAPIPISPAYSPIPPLAQPSSPHVPSPMGYASPLQPNQYSPSPSPASGGDFMPPDMHWAVVLILSWVSFGLGGIVWMYKEAFFVKKIDPDNRAVMLFNLSIVCMLGQILFYFIAFSFRYTAWVWIITNLILLLNLAIFALMITAIFSMRRSLLHHYNEVEPISLRLSGIMTFFFSILYFQYHFSRIAAWKKSGRLTAQPG